MTEPRTPGDEAADPTPEPPTDDLPAASTDPAPNATPSPNDAAGTTSAGAGADHATEAWPSLIPSGTTSSAASWGTPTRLSAEPGAETAEPEAEPAAPVASPYEPAPSLPANKLADVGDAGAATADAPAPSRSRIALRWVLAIVGIVIVIAASALIVSLAGSRPTTSIGLGYMPATIGQYSEVRMDLPGDQRQKLAAFLAFFPGFKDQSQVEPKLNETLDKIVGLVSGGKQTYTANVEPWFAGQIAVGAGFPGASRVASANPLAPGLDTATATLVVVTIKDQAKAEAWLTATAGSALVKQTYNGADVWTASNAGPLASAIGVTDKVLLVGGVDAVHAAIDTKGQGTLATDPDVKAALAQVDRDYVVLTIMRTRPYIDAVVKILETAKPGLLSSTKIDDTLIALIPAWQVSFMRFENDALVSTSATPASDIGFDAANRKSNLLGHAPSNAILWLDVHDVGPTLNAVLSKFRALPETKDAFAQFDQALSLLGGFDGVIGWWGDVAVVVAPGADGTIGGGLLIQPRDQAQAVHFMTTLSGYLTLAGGSSGLTVRTEDHNGTKITIIDYSSLPGFNAGSLPAGYKAELAYAVADGVVVLGYGRDFVASVLDAHPGASLADDARFKQLLGRVGEENISSTFVDLNAIRLLVEPLAKSMAPSSAWSMYQIDVRPYLEHIDTLISATRSDGSLDRGTGAITLRESPAP